jgi:hypothetical protein
MDETQLNAQPADHDEGKNLAIRALVFSFTYGLIRMGKKSYSDDKYILALIGVPTVLLIGIGRLFPDNLWSHLAVLLYLLGAGAIFLSIVKAGDLEKAMASGIKKNWLIVLSALIFSILTFGGIVYSRHLVKNDIHKIITSTEEGDQAAAYVNSKSFGFPSAEITAAYAADSPLLKDYEQCSKNPKVLMGLMKRELAAEITIREYSKTVADWPMPLSYIVYNGDYPSGAYTYAFVFEKSFEDEHYKLKNLIVVIPSDESKRKDRVLQHLMLINSLCRDH